MIMMIDAHFHSSSSLPNLKPTPDQYFLIPKKFVISKGLFCSSMILPKNDTKYTKNSILYLYDWCSMFDSHVQIILLSTFLFFLPKKLLPVGRNVENTCVAFFLTFFEEKKVYVSTSISMNLRYLHGTVPWYACNPFQRFSYKTYVRTYIR